MKRNSLSFRLILYTTLWALLALFVTAWLLSSAFKNSAERNFEDLLTAHLFNLVGSVELAPDGDLTGKVDLGDPRFLQPNSGWYWTVYKEIEKDAAVGGLLGSPSLIGGSLPFVQIEQIAFDEQFRRGFKMTGNAANELQGIQARVVLDDSEDVYRFTVTGNLRGLRRDISAFTRSLLVFLGLFGIGTVLSTFVITRLGLRPLTRATEALAHIRSGKAERLEGEFPSEIEPLVEEMNALISANKSVLERARTQVGNLAHSLKTPLSVLLNESRSTKTVNAGRVHEQVGVMQQQVQRYLDRAQIAAQKGSITARTEIRPVLDRLIRVMKKLNPTIKYSFDSKLAQEDILTFKGEQQDLEEIVGNLLENASRFARSEVVLQLERQNGVFLICVRDDGPGMTEAERNTALKRGARLDESTPGSGLGLSIVKDIVAEYDGTLEFADGENTTGLNVLITLPLAR